jgi:hypothetical protein
MNYEKLKRLAILIIVLLLVILVVTNCDKKEDLGAAQENLKEHQDVPTEVPFDISEVEEDGIARDYTNPTEEEEEEAYIIYGKDGCYFDEKGLHIKGYDSNVILRTQLLLDDFEFIKTIPLPGDKKIDYFEYEENKLRVYLKNMSEKEFEKYLKEIKDIYKYPVTITEPNVVYKADCTDGHRVSASYSTSSEKATFEFKIAQPQEETM